MGKLCSLGYLLAITAAAFLLALPASLAGIAAEPAPRQAKPDSDNDLGVKWLAVFLAADGRMLDLRYEVIDPVASLALLDGKKKMSARHVKTGRILPVPVTRIGPMRQTSSKAQEGRRYTVMFSAPLGLVKQGDLVEILLDGNSIARLKVGNGSALLTPPKAPSWLDPGKQKAWDLRHAELVKNYRICIEHCGYDAECIMRCKTAYKTQYDRLMNEFAARPASEAAKPKAAKKE